MSSVVPKLVTSDIPAPVAAIPTITPIHSIASKYDGRSYVIMRCSRELSSTLPSGAARRKTRRQRRVDYGVRTDARVAASGPRNSVRLPLNLTMRVVGLVIRGGTDGGSVLP